MKNSLKQLRKAENVSLAEVSSATGIPVSTLNHFENGTQDSLGEDHSTRLKKLADFLKTSPGKILDPPTLKVTITTAEDLQSRVMLHEGGMPIRELCFDHIEKYLEELKDEGERRSFLARLQQVFPLPSTIARVAAKKSPPEVQEENANSKPTSRAGIVGAKAAEEFRKPKE